MKFILCHTIYIEPNIECGYMEGLEIFILCDEKWECVLVYMMWMIIISFFVYTYIPIYTHILVYLCIPIRQHHFLRSFRRICLFMRLIALMPHWYVFISKRTMCIGISIWLMEYLGSFWEIPLFILCFQLQW